MNDPYDDDEEYDDEDYYDNSYNPYKWYYKFEFGPDTTISKWMDDLINNIIHNKPSENTFPVNSYFSNTGKSKNFQYLGTNYQNNPIWKKEYFISKPIQQEYIRHLQYHAIHFIKQPHYYRGLFDILN